MTSKQVEHIAGLLNISDRHGFGSSEYQRIVRAKVLAGISPNGVTSAIFSMSTSGSARRARSS